MDKYSPLPFATLLSNALDLRGALHAALFEDNEELADKLSHKYAQHIEYIFEYKVESLGALEQKLGFFFEYIFTDCDDMALLARCRDSLFQDITNIKNTL